MGKLKCKVCGNITDSIFNIKFKQVPICENCANQVTAQQTIDLIHKASQQPNSSDLDDSFESLDEVVVESEHGDWGDRQ